MAATATFEHALVERLITDVALAALVGTRVTAAGLETDITILFGDPATEILTFAEHREADLVAISTHGRSGVNRFLYGSVAEKILRKSHRVVVTVPPLVGH